MNNYFHLSLIAFLIWGLWGFFPKLATKYIDPKSALIYSILGSCIIGFIILLQGGFKIATNLKGIIFSVLTGIAGASGAIFFLKAISKGKASVVVTITALYPLVTILLSFTLLKESLTLKELLGIVFALVAMIFFAL
ncbi:MAG: EamA family transporter [Planctomycetota bacterium]